MHSCDFSPEPFTFNDASGDINMSRFDMSLARDTVGVDGTPGVIPMAVSYTHLRAHET